MTQPDPRKLDAAEPAHTDDDSAQDNRRYGYASTGAERVYTVSDPEQKDPSNTPIRQLTAPLDADDDVVTLVNRDGNSGDVPSGIVR